MRVASLSHSSACGLGRIKARQEQASPTQQAPSGRDRHCFCSPLFLRTMPGTHLLNERRNSHGIRAAVEWRDYSAVEGKRREGPLATPTGVQGCVVDCKSTVQGLLSVHFPFGSYKFEKFSIIPSDM